MARQEERVMKKLEEMQATIQTAMQGMGQQAYFLNFFFSSIFMSKLKVLTQEDLSKISDDFGEILEQEVSKVISTKELEDLDLDIVLSYENEQLDVDVDVGVIFDELSEINQDQITKVIDEAYLKFDSYIDDNFRV